MPLPPDQIPPNIGNDALFYKLALLAIGVPANEIPAYMSPTTFRRIFLLNVGGGGGGGNVISVSGNIVNNTDATRPIVTQVQSDLNVVDQSQPTFVRNQWQADWNETTTTAKSYIQNKPTPYTLPIATNTVLGGVKIGSGINVTADGTISTSGTGSGTVTSVGLTSTDLTVTGSPVTTSGTITANLATIGTANTYNYSTITTDTKGRVTSASSNTPITSITNGTTTITGALTLTAGNNVTITPSGQTLTISATGGGGGTGTVTSVGLSSNDLTITGSPITTTGTITANLVNKGTAGTYNYSTITTDAQGRVTSATANNPINSIITGTTTIKGDLTLVAGNNITLTPSGQNITIDSTGGTSGVTITSPNSTIAVGGTTTNPTLDLAQQGATTGQVLAYNGTKYAPFSLPTIVNSFKANTGTARTGNIALLNGTNTTVVDNNDGSFTINATGGASGITNVTSTDSSVAVTVANEVANLSITGKTIQSLAVGSAGTTRTGALKFIAGTNITITDNGDSTFTFNSTGGGSSYQSSFNTNVTTGVVPLVVNCTDTTQTTTGVTPTSWAWSVIGGSSSDYSFTNSTTATSQNPQITFNTSSAGNTYQIRLLAGGSVTFIPALKTITPTPVPVVSGDFTIDMIFNATGTVTTQLFTEWNADEFFEVHPALVNAQTCVSVTSSVITSSNNTGIPILQLNADDINTSADTTSNNIPQPTFPLTYNATVIAVMNNSNGTTSSKTHTTNNCSYYVPAFWIQNQSKTTSFTVGASSTQVVQGNYTAGQSLLFASGSDVQVLWVAYPKSFTTPPNAYVITQGFPPGLVERVSDTAQVQTLNTVTFNIYGYLLGDTGQQTFSSSLYLETPPSLLS